LDLVTWPWNLVPFGITIFSFTMTGESRVAVNESPDRSLDVSIL
jgi:hypothetical protein